MLVMTHWRDVWARCSQFGIGALHADGQICIIVKGRLHWHRYDEFHGVLHHRLGVTVILPGSLWWLSESLNASSFNDACRHQGGKRRRQSWLQRWLRLRMEMTPSLALWASARTCDLPPSYERYVT